MIENLRKPIGMGMVANLSKDEAMASVLSAESQTNSLFTALIAPLIGFLADWYSPGTGIAIATGVLNFAVAILLAEQKTYLSR